MWNKKQCIYYIKIQFGCIYAYLYLDVFYLIFNLFFIFSNDLFVNDLLNIKYLLICNYEIIMKNLLKLNN